jgi:hypothetical protein
LWLGAGGVELVGVRVLVAIIVSALALGGASACGGTEALSGTSAEKWSADVCGAAKGWQVDFDTQNKLLVQAASNASSVRETRDLLIATLDNEIARTTQLLRELDAAGHPAVENGEKIARDYRQAFGTLMPTLERLRKAVTSLPTDPQGFGQGLMKLYEKFGADADAFIARAKAVKQEAAASSELRSALADTPACQQLHS